MTDWVSIISSAAFTLFCRTGRGPNFSLARADLLALASQVAKRDLAEDLADQPGYVALRCIVHCAPLGRQVIVDEWVKET